MTTYRELGLSTYGGECEICGATVGIEVHHINGDHADNRIENLMPLCGTCHNVATAGDFFIDADRQVRVTVSHNFDTGPRVDIPPVPVEIQLVDFHRLLPTTWELQENRRLLLLKDGVSKAYYVECHIPAGALAARLDFDTVLEPGTTDDPDADEPYRFNRAINASSEVYKSLVRDARGGRPFADIMVEWNTTYGAEKPLKVLGGQHRGAAIQAAVADGLETDRLHGVRVYFRLSAEQRVELVEIANSNIAIPNPLLDRIAEHQLGGQSRAWCQRVGLLDPQQDFTDRLSSENRMTVQVLRAFVTNYVRGTQLTGDSGAEFFSAITIPGTGHYEPDRDYQAAIRAFPTIWADPEFEEAGRQYARLHRMQVSASETAQGELRKVSFRYKAMQPAVAAGWAFVAGALRTHADRLQTLFHLPDYYDKRSSQDPLNAIQLSRAKDANDPNYRGLGTRQNQGEAQKLAELFNLIADPAYPSHVTLDLIKAAIASYYKKKSAYDADRALETARGIQRQVSRNNGAERS